MPNTTAARVARWPDEAAKRGLRRHIIALGVAAKPRSIRDFGRAREVAGRAS